MSIKSLFENIADAIKEKNPNIANVTPVEMPSAIRSIPSGSSTAGGVTYDNTASGLTANNVQDAIDELAEDVSTINSDLSELKQVKTGTTLASLITAVNALSAEEFMTSSVCVNDYAVLKPTYYPSNQKRYVNLDFASATTTMYSGIRLWTDTSQCIEFTKSTNGTLTYTEHSVTSWKLVYIKDRA